MRGKEKIIVVNLINTPAHNNAPKKKLLAREGTARVGGVSARARPRAIVTVSNMLEKGLVQKMSTGHEDASAKRAPGGCLSLIVASRHTHMSSKNETRQAQTLGIRSIPKALVGMPIQSTNTFQR